MERFLHPTALWRALAPLLLAARLLASCRCAAAGVTLITHGFELDSSYPGWVTEMADQIPQNPSFPGTNFTTYRVTVTYNNGYYVAWSRVNGGPPSATDSGEILLELDWSQLSGDLFDSYASTYSAAWPVAWAILQTNLIGELGGHALAELPIHLIGHSRGGSLVSEISRQLGTNGVWTDQVTTLDPYPINNDGNNDFLASVVDAPVHTYASVLFADNYWQNLGAGFLFGDPDGEPVAGAYARQLYTLSGGYDNNHSNVHLWYHGTIDSNTPAGDGSASITSTERQNWWAPYEDRGNVAGFSYSLIGGGDRLSADQPLGGGFPAINAGYNRRWNLGAGAANNRSPLSVNNGGWPNLIRLNQTSTNPVLQGQSIPVALYYQWGRTNAGDATVSFYLDDDFNPLNGNSRLVGQVAVPGTGPTSVNVATVSLRLDATNAAAGVHALYATISGGGRSRCLYAPELVEVISSQQAPVLDIARLGAGQFGIGVNAVSGQTIVLQASTRLGNWLPVATNTFTASRWVYTNNPPAGGTQQYFRAVLGP